MKIEKWENKETKKEKKRKTKQNKNRGPASVQRQGTNIF